MERPCGNLRAAAELGSVEVEVVGVGDRHASDV